jgi:autotransporter-associated beta strand protein
MRNSNTLSAWERILNRLGFESRRKRRKNETLEPAKRRALRMEPLEDRALLTVLTWDPDLSNNGVFGGSGTWTTANAWVDTSTNIRYTWNSSRNGDTAVFTGARGDVQVNASGIKAAKLSFQGLTEENGYCIWSQPLTLTGSGVTIESCQKRLVIASDITNTTADQSWSIAADKWFEFYGAATFTGRSLYVEGDVRFMGAKTHSGWALRTRNGGVATFTNGDLNVSFVIIGNWSEGKVQWLSGGTLTAVCLSFDTGPSVFYQTVGKVKLSRDVQFVCPGTYYLYGTTAELWTPGFNWAYSGVIPTGSQIRFNDCGHLIAKASMTVDDGLSYCFDADNAIIETRGYNVTLNGDMSGPGGIVKAYSGTLTLNGVGTYTGNTHSAAGTFVFGNCLAAQDSMLAMLPDFTCNFNFGSLASVTVAGLGYSHNLCLQNASGNAVTMVVGTTGANATYDGVLSGLGGLVKLGSGTQTLTNTNTYSGGTQLMGGAVCFSSGSLGTTGEIMFANDSTLQWASGNTQDVSSRLNAQYDVDMTLDVGGNSVTFAAPITAPANLHKEGAGTLTLTGANTYTGNTTVHEGTLALNGTLSSSSWATVRVLSGATLAGAGTIDRGVHILYGSTLSPGGASSGTLTVGNGSGTGLIFEDESTFRVDINSGRSGAFDQVVVRGGVVIGNDVELVSDATVGPPAGLSLTIIDNDAADAIAGTFSNGNSVMVGNVSMSILYNGGDGNDLVLTS